MKKVIFLAVLPLFFLACSKEEPNPNVPFRNPTCEDTTDDGRFEAFSMSETAQFLCAYKHLPEAEVPGTIRFQHINSRILYLNHSDYSPYLVFRTNRPVKIFAYLPYYKQQEQYYSWVQTADSSRNDTLNIFNARKVDLQRGCYRLYYVVADSDSGTVLTKGHYDIEVKR